MKIKNNSMDMLNGSILPKIIVFALPIALSSMLQQFFNVADTAVVGRFADSNALGAVGTNAEIVALLVTLSAGLSGGANVLLAKFIGEGKNEKISRAVHTTIVLALIIGVLGAVLGQFIARGLLMLIKTPQSIMDIATVYLKVYFLGYPFLMLYDFGAAILRSKGDSKRPFIALMLSGLLNVGLNLIFVIVFKHGVLGVVLATDIATAFSAVLLIIFLLREEKEFRLTIKGICLKKHML